MLHVSVNKQVTEESLSGGNAYDEFIRQRPDRNALGEFWYDLLDDASRSIIMQYARSQKNDRIAELRDELVSATNRYVRLYSISLERDRVLHMYKGVLQDIITDYGYYQSTADTVCIFNALMVLFTV